MSEHRDVNGLTAAQRLAIARNLIEEDPEYAARKLAEPFGGIFTWADVDALRCAAQTIEDEWGDGDKDAALRAVADRIESLLPPRDAVPKPTGPNVR